MVLECGHLSQSLTGALLDLREVTDILMADPGEGAGVVARRKWRKMRRKTDMRIIKMKRREERKEVTCSRTRPSSPYR